MKDNRLTLDRTENGLSDWEWTTLVGAMRYYQYRQTIVSASFPEKIVSRYWGSGRYGKAVQRKIANQFAMVDHGLNGERDWAVLSDIDRLSWCKFYAFCKGVCNGFLIYSVLDGGKVCKDECFHCETTGRIYPVGMYIHNPYLACYLGDGAQICEGDK